MKKFQGRPATVLAETFFFCDTSTLRIPRESFMEAIFGLLITVIAFGFPFAIIFLVFFIAHLQKKAHTRSWGEFAAQAGLTIKPGGWFTNPTVTGNYKGNNVYLYTYTQGSGKNKTTYTSMVVYLPFTAIAHIRITREGFLSKITKAFGAQDIQVGDPAFDAAYIIKSDTPACVPHLLTPQVRGYMLQGGDAINVTVSRGTVFWSCVGVERNQAMLRYVLELLTMVALRIVELEMPSHRPQEQPEPMPSLHLPPVTVCQNCGAELNWQADRSAGRAVCEYCGKEMTFKFGTVAFRRG
jgi:DNA-directed RNA polymerase subunit RPC12/RpoP